MATGKSNRKPFLSHRKAMGIFESTNGGRVSGWELQVVTQTSSFRRSIASRPSRLATADEFRDATRSVRAIELLDCPRSSGFFSSSGSLAMLAAMRPGFVAGATSLSVCCALR